MCQVCLDLDNPIQTKSSGCVLQLEQRVCLHAVSSSHSFRNCRSSAALLHQSLLLRWHCRQALYSAVPSGAARPVSVDRARPGFHVPSWRAPQDTLVRTSNPSAQPPPCELTQPCFTREIPHLNVHPASRGGPRHEVGRNPRPSYTHLRIMFLKAVLASSLLAPSQTCKGGELLLCFSLRVAKPRVQGQNSPSRLSNHPVSHSFRHTALVFEAQWKLHSTIPDGILTAFP